MSAISGLTRVPNSVAVLVMTAPPYAGLVAPQRRSVEPLIHAPEPVEPARIRRVRVVDGAVLEDERAHPGRFAQERRDVRPDGVSEFRDWTIGIEARPLVDGREVVLDDTLALLLLRDRHAEVVVEVAVKRGRPREAPTHPPLVRLDVGERRTRDRRQ